MSPNFMIAISFWFYFSKDCPPLNSPFCPPLNTFTPFYRITFTSMKRKLMFAGLILTAMIGHAQSNSAEEICPILVGTDLPDAALIATDGKPVQLHDVTMSKKTVIVVYRGGWCPYCNRQLKALAVAEEELKELDFQIVAISPDNPEHLNQTMDKQELSYTLLSDSKLAFTDAIGVGFKVDEKTIKRYENYGIDLVKSSGEDHETLPVPTVLVVDEDGLVHFVYANPIYKVRLHEDVLLAVARAVAQEK